LTGLRWKLGIQPPTIHAFAPGYVAEAEIVTPVTGEVYVDPTVLQMRGLRTRDCSSGKIVRALQGCRSRRCRSSRRR
jgi:hypothetical protein